MICLHCKSDDYLLLFRESLILEKMMKKKDIKKLKLNVVTFFSLLLSLFLAGGFAFKLAGLGYFYYLCFFGKMLLCL